jgi:D-alanyl-D-alanine carboxypeptidase
VIKIDKDYQNFVERMGSFEDNMALTEDNLGLYQSNSRKIVTRNRRALNDDELLHYGKLGMKWGHHKAINANVVGKAAKAGQDLASLGQTLNKNRFNKKESNDVKDMSDDDLKKLTARLNLENNYINAKNQQMGRDKVERILTTTGSVLAVAASAATLYETVKKFKG